LVDCALQFCGLELLSWVQPCKKFPEKHCFFPTDKFLAELPLALPEPPSDWLPAEKYSVVEVIKGAITVQVYRGSLSVVTLCSGRLDALTIQGLTKLFQCVIS
jgi:hypothetical protein